MIRRRTFAPALALVMLLTGIGGRADEPPPQLPTEAFARLPLVEDVALSPDGQRYAALVNSGNGTYLATRETRGGTPLKTLFQTDNKQFQFGWIGWANNERLLVSLRYPSERNWVDSVETRLLSMRRDGTDVRNLVRRPAFGEQVRVAQFQDQVVDWMPDDPQHILLQINDDNEPLPSVFRVDVETGRRTKVQGARAGVYRWISDRTHRVRVGVKQRDAKVAIEVCDPDGGNWRTAWSYEVFDRAAVTPLGFGADANLLYVLADHEGREAVFVVDLRDPQLPKKLVLADPGRDLGGHLLYDPHSNDAVGINSSQLGNGSASFWDPAYRSFAAAIDKALPERFNRLIEFTADGSRYLLVSSGNGVAPQFFFGNRSTGELALLADTYPELDSPVLVKKRPVMLTARDGMALPGFLSLPRARAPTNLPAVILPHGGPISTDTIDFDPWAQFLAHRGYAVLQVNFRGSAGFGHEHMQAGLKQWGLAMQDDLSDAVAWLGKQGIADPGRVCIVGGSYGGYAALMGVAKTPKLYRCAVSFAGVTDLLDLAAHERQYVNMSAVFARQVGSSWDDRDQLKATSPVRLADKIEVPVLLMHGTLDRSVPFEQSEDMADALKSAGKRVRFVKQEDGDHHLSHYAHRLQFFQELERFLAENLKPGAAVSN